MARWLLLASLLLSGAARADVAPYRPFEDDCGQRTSGCCARTHDGADAGFGACVTRPATCEDVGVVGKRGAVQPDDGGCCLRDPSGDCERMLSPPIPYCDVASPGAAACQPRSRLSCASAQAAGPWALALAVPLLLRRRAR